MTTRKGEVGRIGQKRYGGVFYEEFLPELRGRLQTIEGTLCEHSIVMNDA